MDSLSALGLAASIIQFVDFATKIVHGTRQIYETGTGTASENADIELCALELQDLCGRLNTNKLPFPASADDDALRRLADRCVAVSNELLVLLSRIKARDSNSKWHCMVSAVKTQLKKTERDDILSRLSQCRAQLDSQLCRLASLNNQTFREQVSVLLQSNDCNLQSLMAQLRNLQSNITVSSFSPHAEDQLRQLFCLPEDSHRLVTSRRVLNVLQFEDMQERFDDISIAHEGTLGWIFEEPSLEPQNKSVRTVEKDWVLPEYVSQPASIRLSPQHRHPLSTIVQSVFSTDGSDMAKALEDLVNPDELSVPLMVEYMAPAYSTSTGSTTQPGNVFTDWLRGGTHVFHFVGTAGSGKSTLMKFICDHPTTMQLLSSWANPRKLVTAKFFFWNTGTKKQRTMAGLCRSFLHDIVAECPDLTPVALPDLWKEAESTPWQVEFKHQLRSNDIRGALTRLIRDLNVSRGYCFVLFIDGLDEHQEEQMDYDDLVSLLTDLARSSPDSVKLCVSSQPSRVFLDAFDNSQRIWLHQHIRTDQKKFVLDRLRNTFLSHDDFSEVQILEGSESEHRIEDFAERIVDRCEGDFRQLSLITKRARQMLDSRDDSHSILCVLDALTPEDIDRFFHDMETGNEYCSRSALRTGRDWTYSTSAPAAIWPIDSISGAIDYRGIALARSTSKLRPTLDQADARKQYQMDELLKHLDLSEDLEEDILAARNSRMTGTCEWFTTKAAYSGWRNFDSDDPRILWVTANPATGKSTLSGYVVDEITNSGVPCSFFFFKYANQDKSLVSACLRSLASQMARTSRVIREKLIDILRVNPVADTEKNNERLIWHKLFLNGIFCVPLARQYWVIDGLDECGNPPAAFRTFLSKLDHHIPLRILATSRETPSLRSDFADLGPSIFQKETISAVDTLPDIKVFVEAKALTLVSTDSASRARLVEQVVAKSRGSFLWTSLVLKELSHSYSEEEMHRILEEVPRGMEPLYHRTLEMMSQGERRKSLAKALLFWTTCATRPLKVVELEGALKPDFNENFPKLESTVQALCGQLVTIDNLSNVQIVHETAREFLLDEHLQSEFAVDKKQAHTRIAKTCLEYLNGEEMKLPRSIRKITASVATKKRAPFSAYACTNFSYHLAEADETDGGLLLSLLRFLEANVLSWIEAIARTSDLRPLIQAAKNLKRYVDRCAAQGDLHPIVAWSTDLVRISARFANALVAAPSAIFALIPPLCPTSSAIYKSGQQGRGLPIVGLINPEWGNRLTCIEFRSQTSATCYGPDYFAVGLFCGTVTLYHAVTGQEYKSLVHGEPVSLIQFLDRSGLMASCGNKTIHIWDVPSGEIKHTIEAPQRCIELAYGNGLLIAACDKNYLASWDLNGDVVRKLDKPWNAGDEFADSLLRRPPSAVSISLEHKMLAVASPGRPIILWNLEDDEYYGSCGKKLANGEPSRHLITALVFNPNSALELLAASYLDGELVTLDPFNDETLAIVHANCPKLAASPDGRLLAGAAGAGTIDIYGFESLRLVYRVQSSNLYVKQLAFSKDSLHFVDIRGSQCNVWEPAALRRASIVWDTDDATTHIVEAAGIEPKARISTLLIRDKQNHVLCGKDDGSVVIYNLESGNEESLLYRHKSRIHILVFWPYLEAIMSVDESNSITAWPLRESPTSTPIPKKPLFQTRLDCGSTINQLVPGAETGRFILATRDSDHLWTLDGPNECKRLNHDSPGIRKWIQHPLLHELVICTDGSAVRIYTWANWSEIAHIPLSLLSINVSGYQVKNLVPCVIARKQKLLLELSELHGGADTRGLLLLDIAPINTDNDHIAAGSDPSPLVSPATQLPHFLSTRISHIIGVSDSQRLIFLDGNSWVCSIALDQKPTTTAQFSRHFYIPYDWFSGTRGIVCALSRHNIVFARNDRMAIFKGGLDFTETIKVPLEE